MVLSGRIYKILIFLVFVFPVVSLGTEVEGFYKDLFINGGVRLSSQIKLPAVKSLGLSSEYYVGEDEQRQNEIIRGSEIDQNGALLYPDGSPRFRIVYLNGGSATRHGKTLTEEGRQRFRDFYYNGGNYAGSCAGSFITGRNTGSKSALREGYFHIFPHNTQRTKEFKIKVGHSIPDNSPLLNFRSFGGDGHIQDVFHNNGNWFPMDETASNNIEVLAAYDQPGAVFDKEAAIWAYKKNEQSGRLICIGSHPEFVKEEKSVEIFNMVEATFLYALEGQGEPRIKAILKDKSDFKMLKDTVDGDPLHTKIGGKQYHHFKFVVEPRHIRVALRLDAAKAGDQLNLYLNKNEPAFKSKSIHSRIGPGKNKKIVKSLDPGVWYASVECDMAIDAEATSEMKGEDKSRFFEYSGRTDLLNGIPYRIRLNMKSR